LWVEGEYVATDRAYLADGQCRTGESVRPMKFGIRTPSLKRSLAARTSVKRIARHNLGLKAPRGWGWLTNPKRAAYNRVYDRTTISFWSLLKNLFS